MPDQPRNVQAEYWATKFEDIGLEIARLATICNVRILDTGVIERVLRNDASVCGTAKSNRLRQTARSNNDALLSAGGRARGLGGGEDTPARREDRHLAARENRRAAWQPRSGVTQVAIWGRVSVGSVAY